MTARRSRRPGRRNRDGLRVRGFGSRFASDRDRDGDSGHPGLRVTAGRVTAGRDLHWKSKVGPQAPWPRFSELSLGSDSDSDASSEPVPDSQAGRRRDVRAGPGLASAHGPGRGPAAPGPAPTQAWNLSPGQFAGPGPARPQAADSDSGLRC